MSQSLPSDLRVFVPSCVEATIFEGHLHVVTMFKGHRAENYLFLDGRSLDGEIVQKACAELLHFAHTTEPPE